MMMRLQVIMCNNNRIYTPINDLRELAGPSNCYTHTLIMFSSPSSFRNEHHFVFSDRPSVAECLQHPWISGHSEPPSPSPLMLKIPAPDHFNKLSVHHHPSPSPSGSSGSSRRSCLTCRDKLSERKRYLSKSREAIFEKVTNSNLKKSLSKSRERLCDMRLTLGKSREYLNNESKLQGARSQEKFHSFKSLSKSQEVLSQGLGGSMRRINGAVSDISPHHLPVNPRVYLDTPDNSCDFVMLPGSSVLMSHSELMSISGIRNSSSLQLLPISESGRSTPASLCSNATVADIPYREEPCNDIKNDNIKNTVVTETLVEEAEEDIDEYDNKNRSGHNNNNNKESREKATSSVTRQLSNNNLVNSRRKSKQETSLPRTCSQKEEKNNINYETKQSLSRSSGANNNLESNNNKHKNSARNNSNATASTTSTAEVAIQVDDKDLTNNVPTTQSKQEVVRRKEKLEKSDSTKSSKNESTSATAATTTPAFNNIQVDGNMRPGPQDKKLTRGFSHDNTLGEDTQKRYSWREDLEKFRTMKKPLAVSQLIDAFSTNSMQRKVSADDPSFPNVDSLKNKRRGSLQIQIDPKSLAKLTETSENSDSVLKALRRKSTSAIMPLRLSEVTVGDRDETGDDSGEKKDDDAIVRDADDSKHIKEDESSEKTVGSSQSRESVVDSEDGATGSNESINNTAYLSQSLPKGRVYLEKVNERKRTWDYFEINHPKAISDKKLEQLKAKYTRRKTENDILSKSNNNKDKNANDKSGSTRVQSTPPVVRTQTLAVFEGLEGSPLPKKSLDLAFDPLTGECLETQSVDSGRESEMTRKLSSDSSDEGSSSRKSSKSGRRKSSNLGDILESENIPEEAVLECFIDPFTGTF